MPVSGGWFGARDAVLRLALEPDRATPNKRMELAAPRGGRAGDGVMDAAASRSPFGERRRRSSSAVFARLRHLVRYDG